MSEQSITREDYDREHPYRCPCSAHKILTVGPAWRQQIFTSFIDPAPWTAPTIVPAEYGPCQRWNGSLHDEESWWWFDPAIRQTMKRTLARYVYAQTHGERALTMNHAYPRNYPIVAICARPRCCAPAHMFYHVGNSYVRTV